MSINGQTDGNEIKYSYQCEAQLPGQVLDDLTTKYKISFAYNPLIFEKRSPVQCKINTSSELEFIKELAVVLEVNIEGIEGQYVITNISYTDRSFEFSGFVKDANTGEDLIGATIKNVKGNSGVFSNEFGFFSLSLAGGKQLLEVSYIGYQKQRITLDLKQDVRKTILLSSELVRLPSIIVKPQSRNIIDEEGLEKLELSPSFLNGLPEFGGQSGLVKGLQSLVGIKTHSDASAFYFVRGGQRDHNLIIIDDTPIYNPSHLAGIYSIVLPDFSKSIDIYKDDTPTYVGDRLASIVTIRTKDGNLNKAIVSASLNPLLNRISIEIPTVKNKSALFLSYRRSNYQWLLSRGPADNSIFFQDFHFKWNYQFNPENKLFVTIIQSEDRVQINNFSNADLVWRNAASSIRYNHVFNSKVFSNVTFNTSNYRYTLGLGQNLWQSELSSISLKNKISHYHTNALRSYYGGEIHAFFNAPGKLSNTSGGSAFPEIDDDNSRKLAAFYQTVYSKERLKLKAGLRYVFWANAGPNIYYTFDSNFEVADTIQTEQGIYNYYNRLDPRISIEYAFNETSKIKLAYGRYHQYLQLLLNSVSPFTALEIWLPSGPNIEPQSADQYSASFMHHVPKANIHFVSSVYYKRMDNQIDFKDHAITFLNPLIEGELRFGKARAYGFECSLDKRVGSLQGGLNYTYSRVFRSFPDINEGKAFRAFQDRPHDFSAAIQYQAAERLFLSSYFTFQTGSPFSSPIGYFPLNGLQVPIYGEKHNDRLPNYRRFDFSAKLILNKDPMAAFQHSLTFSIYNALGQLNPYAIKFNKVADEDSAIQVPSNMLETQALSPTQVSLIRFYPSISYKFQFSKS